MLVEHLALAAVLNPRGKKTMIRSIHRGRVYNLNGQNVRVVGYRKATSMTAGLVAYVFVGASEENASLMIASQFRCNASTR